MIRACTLIGAICILALGSPVDAQRTRSAIEVSVVELKFGVSYPTAINNAGYVAGQANDDH
jgi:hypothetical protein